MWSGSLTKKPTTTSAISQSSIVLLVTGLACRPADSAPPVMATTARESGESQAITASLTRRSAALAAHADGELTRLVIGDSQIDVAFERGAYAIGDARLIAWIERCARAVQAYYGAFPVNHLRIELSAFEGRGLRSGRVFPRSLPTIEMSVGTRTPQMPFERNWSMTHEMVHLAFPNVAEAHLWLEEGLASYVEPIARARSGWLSEDAVWQEWIENLPRGLPEDGDLGLDHTPTWARTYWGGALFCFLADLGIRKGTDQKRDLGDALRAILSNAGNITRRVSIERALAIGDEATGTHVLTELYHDMKDAPRDVDLDAIWRDLGVRFALGRIEYDDTAPLSALRRQVVMGR